MTSLTESQQNIIMSQLFQPFSSTSIEFEKIVENIPTFGKIKLNINKFPNTKKHLDLHFQLDNSGSMNDMCADNRTKMEHMNFTVENIIRYLQEHNISATISLNSFDDKIKNIISSQELNSENIEDFASKIRKIRANGGTNIENVLEMEVSFKKTDNYSSERIFLMFTDGQASTGKINTKELKKLADKISDTTTIITVGCGLDHDYELLNSIADRKNSNYKFIGKLEEAALACGEILDKILNKILTNVVISVQNGEIYNWKTNEWTNNIETENIVGECNKSYNVRSTNPNEFKINISAIIIETGELFEHSITDKIVGQDLSKDKYRQKTLELLFEINYYNKNKFSIKTVEINKEFKNKLKDLLKEMKKFMDDNKLRDDLFMKMLCDDIFVCHRTFGTSYGNMYITSRQTSQATQGIHNNTPSYDDFELPPSSFNFSTPTLTRSVTTKLQTIDNDNDNDYDDELPPPISLSRGLTQRIQRMEDEDEDELNASYNIKSCAKINFDMCDYNNLCSLNPPKLKRTINKNVGFADEDEDIFSNYKTMESDTSPYSNLKTLTMMSEVSYTLKDEK